MRKVTHLALNTHLAGVWSCLEFRVYAVLSRLKAELRTVSVTFTTVLAWTA